MDGPIIGAYPDDNLLKDLVSSLRQRLRETITPTTSPIERHNAYTDYCLALLFCCTGHRTVKDPFQSLSQFDLDDGLLLVADKIHTENRAWRLVALPPTAVGQMRAYLDYLPKLAMALEQRNWPSESVNQLRRIATNSSPDMPLFFYLDEQKPGQWQQVTPSVMASRWEDFWPLPVNFLRHIAATELLNRTERADWVQIQLGHMSGVNHPLGMTSTQSPLAILSEIRPHGEAMLQELGWKIIGSPLRATGANPTQENYKTVNGQRKNKGYKNGYQQRAEIRLAKAERAATLVKEVLNRTLIHRQLSDVTKEEFNDVLENIIQDAANKGVSPKHCVLLVYRFLRRIKGGQDLLRRASKVRPIEPEPSPFTEKTLDVYKQLKTVRKAFIGYLDKHGRAKTTSFPNQRQAEIGISAALFGGIANIDWVNRLIDLSPHATYRIGDNVFLDIPLTKDSNAPVLRWHPDPISLGLLVGFHAPLLSPPATKDSRKPSTWVNAILHDIGEGAVQTLEDLISLTSTGLILEMPGFVANVLNGVHPAVSIPIAQLVRVATNKALVESNERGDEMPVSESSWLPTLTGSETQKYSMTLGTFLAHLQILISASRDVAHCGVEKKFHKQKRAFAKSVKEYATDTHGWPQLAVALAAWTIQLCRSGTRSKSDLAYNTINDYVNIIAEPLAHVVGNQRLFDYSDIQFEEIYLKALSFRPITRREKLAGRLQEFHYFLVKNYAVDEIDWSAIMSSCGRENSTYYSDANIITQTEYEQIFDQISRDGSISPLLRLQYATLLLLGYRFGLRFGEAWRLQYRDIQHDNDLETVWLYIRDTVFGEVKTTAAIRLVPLLERLTDIEKSVLRGLFQECEMHFEADQLVAIMADSRPRTLIDRSLAARYLNNLLRHYTGDGKLRFHHLRHSWVTRMIGSFFLDRTESHNERLSHGFFPENINDDSMSEFLGDGLVQYPLRSISMATGHVRESTTVTSYCHCIDAIAGKRVSAQSPILPDFAQAYCLQTASATIRRRRSRS